MGIKLNNFASANKNMQVTESLHGMSVIEYLRDVSTSPGLSMYAFYSAKMGIRKRQLAVDLNKSPVVVQAGAMQWTAGRVTMETGIKGAGDFIGKMVKGKATGESAVKPKYSGSGILVLEPTYKHLILLDVRDWGGSITLSDGMFLACEAHLDQRIQARNNVSSAVLGGEGLFNLMLRGQGGAVCLESDCPKEDLVEIELHDDEAKIDGNYAVCWSSGLQFTVEKSGKSFLGSAVSGEGFVNVYRGTGKIWMEPTGKMPNV